MTGWRNRGIKHMFWASYLFNDINDMSNPVTVWLLALMKILPRGSVLHKLVHDGI